VLSKNPDEETELIFRWLKNKRAPFLRSSPFQLTAALAPANYQTTVRMRFEKDFEETSKAYLLPCYATLCNTVVITQLLHQLGETDVSAFYLSFDEMKLHR
jgi:hypothetical protein